MGDLGLVPKLLSIGKSLSSRHFPLASDNSDFLQYAPYLRAHSTTLGTVAFEKIEDSKDAAAHLLKRVWNVSTGQEA